MVILVALGIVVGLWCWGALQRWAAPKVVPKSYLDSDGKHQ